MTKTISNTTDPRVIKTRKQFLDAFKELVLFYDDYMSITVKELCDKAGLNRKTFYLHYKQVDDLFLILQDEYIEEFYNRTKDFDFSKEIEKVVGAYFDINEENPVYKKMATTSIYFYTKDISRKKTLLYFLARDRKNLFGEHNDTVQDILYRHFHMTVYIMYKQWALKNYQLPKDEMIALTAQLVKNGISSFD